MPRKLVALLFRRKVEVYLVSGGLREVIEPLADHLSIHRDHIFANRLLFNEDGICACSSVHVYYNIMCDSLHVMWCAGQYIGFDETEPTSRSGGKPRVISELKKKHRT